MAGKWRAQQRRQRWEHSAVFLPTAIVDCLSSSAHLHDFRDSLLQWSSLGNTYEQVAGAKHLVSALESLTGIVSRIEFSLALSVYVEVFFQEGSRPMHRTLLSPLAHFKGFDDPESLVVSAFEKCCQEYGMDGCKRRRFALISAGLSLVNFPKPGLLKAAARSCAALIATSASNDVADVLKRAQDGENPTPAVMEECQDAMSTVYYMVQNFPDKFQAEKGVGSSSYESVVAIALDVLQTTLMSRDTVVAAAVCLCAAAQMRISQIDLSLLLAESMFPLQQQSQFVIVSEQRTLQTEGSELGMLEETIRNLRSSSLACEAQKLTDFGRLCTLRGLLTAVPRAVLNHCLLIRTATENEMQAWTLLYDGILPALCASCESSFDSHFKFHAVTAMQICLQQVKASITGNTTAAAIQELDGFAVSTYSPFPPAMTSRMMQIIWNNWEDPLNQTVKQVQLVFDLLADLQSLPYVQSQCEGTKTFLLRIAHDLLTVGGHRKGRYVPLATLASRIGAKTLLEMCPDLLFQSVYAMSDDGVCCAASSFLKMLLERLREEFWSESGVTEGNRLFRRLWVPPILAGLVAGIQRLRVNVNTYALPVGLQIDGDTILALLGFVLDGSTSNGTPDWEELRGATGMPAVLTQNQRVAAFVSLIKVARSLALMEEEIKASENESEMIFRVKGTVLYAPVALLELATTHLEEGLRVDAAEIICLNPKTAVMPSPLEIHLLKLAMPVNMRCSSTAFRMKWTSLLRKFFSRVKVATDRQTKLTESQKYIQVVPSTKVLTNSVVTLSEMQSFMQWLNRLLISSLYPSAPYERKYMAMEILNVMLDAWRISHQPQKFSPYGKELLSTAYTSILLGAVVDSWDRLRESAFKILVRYPTPIPGLVDSLSVQAIFNWGKSLAGSPRVRESDAGALILRLVFRKYVCELGWTVTLHPEVQVSKVDTKSSSGEKIVTYIESLNDWLEAGVCEGEKDLVEACKQSLVHGVLLTYRYTVDEIEWVSDAVKRNVSGLRKAFQRLFTLLLKVTSLALWVVSADALILQEKQLGNANEKETLFEEGDDSAVDEEVTDEDATLAPREQMIMVACWLSMKEVSLLLGSIARGAPLPGCSYNSSFSCTEDSNSDSSVLLGSQQLGAIGQHFLEVLLAMKHNGAIDKTRVGFVALCNRLLLSSDPRLSKMPEIWMQQLMLHTSAKGQSVDDLLRRSAGIPAAFLGLFLAEPDGAPKKLLPMALGWFLDRTSKFLSTTVQDTRNPTEEEANGKIQFDDEQVVPVVHAFNTLRVTFNDTNLATDTSGFCAQGLILSIQAFSSPYWQIRNSATLAFTAILHRTVGFLNVHKQATARRAITGFEFFHRYPALHPFLLNELKSATMQLEHGADGSKESRLHPSLAPVLVILSRLRPSIVNTRVEDWLSPSAFMPYIMRCATQCNFKVRVLASRALAPLVTFDNLLRVLLELSSSLPTNKSPSHCSYNAIHGVLLQLSSLLRANCTELPDHEQQAEAVIQVFRKLSSECTWLGSARRCSCFTVVTAFLNVLQDLLEVGELCLEEYSLHPIRNLLLNLSAENMMKGNTTGWDSTLVSLRATASEIYLGTVLRAWVAFNMESSNYKKIENSENEILRASLSDEMYEVRLSTLKMMKQISKEDITKLRLRSDEFVGSDAKEIYGLLIQRLYIEKHPKCVKRLLEVLVRWDLLKGTIQDCEKLWYTLLNIYRNSKVSKTREFAVSCLGSCMQQITNLFRNSVTTSSSQQQQWVFFHEVIEDWVDLIQQCSAADRPVTLRRAIAEAIISSECLMDVKWVTVLKTGNSLQQQQQIEWYGKTVLTIWATCIKLMEDEDALLRQHVAVAVLQVISCVTHTYYLPACVEKVLEMSLKFLKMQYERCEFFFEFLANWVMGEEEKEKVNRDSDLVERLFDKEVDNHHEEELLVVQLCCEQMRSVVVSDCGLIERWQMRFVKKALVDAQWCLELGQMREWVGGVTNHQDAFKSVYRKLVGLLMMMMSSSSSLKNEVRNGVVEIADVLRKLVPLNPLVSNLLLKLLEDCQVSSDDLKGVMNDSFCSEFEPLFLLT